MLKYLIKKGYVDINKILLDNYSSLGLTENELIIVLKLFDLLRTNQSTISVLALSKKTSMSQNDCSSVLNGLFNRGLVTINLEYTKQGKAKESFNLDDLIKYIEDYLNNDFKSLQIMENETLVKQMTGLVEQTFKRPLTPLEMQIIADWSLSGETIQSLQQALALATSANKLNIKYVDSCLANSKNNSDIVLSDEKTKILNDFYNKIK